MNPSSNSPRILQLPVWKDNYAYLIVDEPGKTCALVDSPEAGPVLNALQSEGLTLKAIWNTHTHPDHIGSNKQLVAAIPGLEVCGNPAEKEKIPGFTRGISHGDTLSLGNLSFQVRAVPGHTAGHLAFFGHGALFIGDTLFSLGCGRIFDGNPEQFFNSLYEVLGDVPDDTDVYCAHEYTESNLKFARHLLPSDKDLEIAAREILTLREMDLPTVPSTMNFERSHNPFLRCHEPMVADAVKKLVPECGDSALAVFTAMRGLKDRF